MKPIVVNTFLLALCVFAVSATEEVDEDGKISYGDIGQLSGGSDRTVCGADTRERVFPSTTLQKPYNGDCFIRIYRHGTSDRGYWKGTAYLINVPGSRGSILLTSGHCTYMKKYRSTPGLMIVRCPGNDDIRVGSSHLHADPGYKGYYNTADHDIGAIFIDKQMNGGYDWKFAEDVTTSLRYKPMKTWGYPGDKPSGQMWKANGLVHHTTAQRIFYMADTYGGQSGSPVFVTIGGKDVVLGTHSYGGCPNSAVKLTKAHMEPILRMGQKLFG